MYSNDEMSSIHREIKEIWNILDRLKSFDVPSQENLDDRPINLNEFFATTASDIGGIYYVMTETEAAAGTVVSASITSATTTNCFNFATVVGSPHLTRLVSGFYDVHAHLLKTGTRTVNAYAELYKRTSGGTETLLGTSPITAALTASDTFYDVYIHLGTEVTLVTTDRLVLKWYMITDGAPAGSGTTMTMTVGGAADPHLSVEIQTQELNNIFVLISEYITGWITETSSWTYASATTLTITGDVTARFPVGTKIKLTQTTVKYFYVVSAAYGAPNTTLTLTGGSDYSLANAAITLPYYSYQAMPQGFPDLFTWTPAVDQNGARTITVAYAYFRIASKSIQVWMRLVITDAGTAGNAISLSGLPVVGTVQNNNAVVGTYQYLRSGIVFYNGAAVMVPDGVHLAFYVSGQADKLGVLPSFATANNDELGLSISYMIAS